MRVIQAQLIGNRYGKAEDVLKASVKGIYRTQDIMSYAPSFTHFSHPNISEYVPEREIATDSRLHTHAFGRDCGPVKS